MKHRVTLFFFFLFSISNLVSQNKDSIYVTTILDESKKYIEFNPTKAAELAKEAREISYSKNYKTEIIVSNNILGVIHFYKGEHEKSIEYYRENVEVAKAIGDNDFLGVCYLNIGVSYFNLGKYNDCVRICLKALEFLDKRDDTKITVYKELAGVYNIVKQHKKAIEALEKAYIICNDKKSNLEDSKINEAEILNELGETHFNLGDTELAFKYYRKSENILNKYSKDNDFQKVDLYENLSHYYLHQNKIDSALVYAQNAEKLTLEETLDVIKPRILKLLGDIHSKKKAYSLAESYYINTETLLKTVKDKEIETELALDFSKFYAKQNNFSKAYEYAEKHIVLNDSITKVNNIRILSDITASYEAEKKDNEINTQKLKIKRQENLLLQQQRKNILIYIIIGFVIIILIISLIFYKNKQRLKIQEIKRLKAENKLAKLDAIIEGENKERKRIAKDLHDNISGNLAAIKMKLSNINDSQSEEMDAVISNLDTTYNDVRTISHNLLPQEIIKQTFTENINQLVILYTSETLKIKVDIFPSEEINRLPQKMEVELYRILQELITNIVKHAKATICTISITLHDNYLNLIVEDNGKGYNTNKKSKGIGLSNILSRIDSMNGSLDIDSLKGKGTTVNVNISIN